jgi:hypothetical protein
LPLYDSHGNLIPSSVSADPAKTQVDKSPKELSGQSEKPKSRLASAIKYWLSGWRLFADLVPFGILLALYSIRPVLSVTSLSGTGIDGVYGAKVTVSESGLPIREVSVRCVTNKVVFEDRFTAEFERYVSVEEYSVGDVKPGESFTVNCNLAWSFWDMTDRGVLVLGYPTPGQPNMAIPFRYINETPVVTSGPAPASMTFGFADAVNYRGHAITAVDGSFVVSYKWYLCPFRENSTIHVIASPGPEDGIKWRIAPASEPVIADAKLGGWKLTAKSNTAKFGVTMKRAN